MRIVVTGSAGFIGFHLARNLLDRGHRVMGVDAFTNYYDVQLKEARNEILSHYELFQIVRANITDLESLRSPLAEFAPEAIVHLAAQAGVRYSLEAPRSYIDANLIGTFNIMELAKEHKVQHLLMASTSSVYGANTDLPFCEATNTDRPLTIYSATKKANEVMSYSYSHLWRIPVTVFRFFTVYGPWGRPDMALFKFTKAMLEDKPIDVYNRGEMTRDFTYIDDLVASISMLISRPPSSGGEQSVVSSEQDTPFRVLNIGNSDQVKLLSFIEAIEAELGCTARKNLLPMQTGDVPSTWADTSRLESIIGYKPATNYKEGISRFVRWYRSYYNC